MKDIKTRKDVEFLINEFYQRILKDKQIGYFFTEIVVLNWNKHIPIMYDFWESILFSTAKYKGNPMEKHLAINQKEKLKKAHFDKWIQLWESTILENFVGKNAEKAIEKAKQIGSLMQFKIEQLESKNQ